jgi:hypothetical protein|tara:strand:- start:2692 stop:2997 length:306 start_codon:yes stop_codon:yes gene_type:complete
MSSFELFLDNFGLVIIWILLAVSCFLCLLKFLPYRPRIDNIHQDSQSETISELEQERITIEIEMQIIEREIQRTRFLKQYLKNMENQNRLNSDVVVVVPDN